MYIEKVPGYILHHQDVVSQYGYHQDVASDGNYESGFPTRKRYHKARHTVCMAKRAQSHITLSVGQKTFHNLSLVTLCTVCAMLHIQKSFFMP